MTKSILQNGDLLFISDVSELSKAIIETTEKYSHVGIYFDGYINYYNQKRCSPGDAGTSRNRGNIKMIG